MHTLIYQLPFHTSYGVRSIDFNTTDYLIGSRVCSNYLGKPGRIGATNARTYLANFFIYGVFFMLAIYFRDEESLKSRNYSPILVLSYISLNLTFEFIGTNFSFEDMSGMCWYSFIIYALITGSCVCYSVMALRFFLIKIINNQKVKVYEKMKVNEKIPQSNLLYVILKYMAHPLFGLSLSLLLILFEEMIFIFVFGAIYKFDCGNYRSQFVRYIHTVIILLIPVSYIIFQLYDILINFRLIFIEWNLKKLYVQDDPFLFRFEVIYSIPLPIVVLLWGTLNLSDYIRIALTEIILILLMFCTGGFALGVTVYRFMYKRICKKRG